MRLPNSVPIFEYVADLCSDSSTCVSDTTGLNQSVCFANVYNESLGTTITAYSTESSGPSNVPSKKIEKLVRTIQSLKQRDLRKSKTIKLLRQNLARTKKFCGNKENAASKLFNPDQVTKLQRGQKRVKKWSDKTITDSFEYRFACGSKGYNFLRDERNFPIPSIRSQQDYLKNLHFDTGVLVEVFTLMEPKVNSMSSAERDCGLIADEMSIDPSRTYCCNNKKYFADITIPGQCGKATHGLVFMLVGVSSRWKQIVAYHFSGNSVPEGFMKATMIDIIRRAEQIGLKVHFATTDCGPNNVRMWNDFGLKHSKDQVLNSPPLKHPVDADRTFELIPDAVHVFKSCVQGWVKNRFIYLPADIVKENNLTSDVVDIFHLQDLVNFEKGKRLKMASRLTWKEVDFLNGSRLDAMKVSNSYKLVNHDVAAALRFMSAETGRKELLSTAFFIETTWRWFKLMSSRQSVSALSLHNMDAYRQSINFLTSFRKLIFDCKVGIRRAWKPWQSAAILCTNSILRLQKHFLVDQKYPCLFTSRFTQDCVENVFSLIRFKQKRPTALQFKDNLKLLSVSQFMMPIPSSSYDHDDRKWLTDFTSKIRNLNQTADTNNNEQGLEQDDALFETEFPDTIFDDETFDNSEKNQIYHIAGYIIGSVAKNYKVCEDCFMPCISEYPFLKPYTKYSILKDYTGDSLIYVTEPVYLFFVALERIFRENIEKFVLINDNIASKLTSLMKSLNFSFVENCHDIRSKIIDRFVNFRLKIHEPYKSRSIKHDSRSMAL